MSRHRTLIGVIWVAIWPALIFLLAGTVRWVEAWLFAAWMLGVYAANTLWMQRHNPGLLEERRKRPQADDANARGDRPLLLLMFIGYVAWFIVMPLDAQRYRWTASFPIGLQLLGLVLLVAAAWFLLRAFRDNPFLSGVVRVQDDRGHHVVSTGVYAVVRHPMYAGMVLMAVGGALLLGSSVGLLAAGYIAIVLAVRCLREERVLAGQLDGYAAYQSQVRARLIPYVW